MLHQQSGYVPRHASHRYRLLAEIRLIFRANKFLGTDLMIYDMMDSGSLAHREVNTPDRPTAYCERRMTDRNRPSGYLPVLCRANI